MIVDASLGRLVGNWKGVNQYAVDSWMIFICGAVIRPQDKELLQYLEWCRENGVSPPAFENEDGLTKPEPLRVMRIK